MKNVAIAFFSISLACSAVETKSIKDISNESKIKLFSQCLSDKLPELFSENNGKYPVVKKVVDKGVKFKSSVEQYSYLTLMVDLFTKKEFRQLNTEIESTIGFRTVIGDSLSQKVVDNLVGVYDSTKLIEEWNSVANSAFSEYLMAKKLNSKAWEERGNDWAYNVTKSGWTGFKEFKKQALTHLNKSIKLNNSFSPTLCLLTSIKGSSIGVKELQNWVLLSLYMDPSNVKSIETLFHFSQPRWGGSFELLEELGKELFAIDQAISPTIITFGTYITCMLDREVGVGENTEEKIKYLQELVSLYNERYRPCYPKSGKIWSHPTSLAFSYKLYDLSKKYLDSGLKEFPESSTMKYLEILYVERKQFTQFKKRFELLENYTKINPKDGLIWFKLAELTQEKPFLQPSQVKRNNYLENATKYLKKGWNVRKVQNFRIKTLLNNGKVSEAEKIIEEFGIVKNKDFAKNCGAFAKYYYAKGKQHNPDKAWKYFMLPYTVDQFDVNKTGLSLNEILNLAIDNSPENAEEWYDYACKRFNYYQRKYYPQEGIIGAFRKTVESINEATPERIKHKATYYLAKELVRAGKREEAIPFYKMSIEAVPDTWNTEELVRSLEFVSKKQKKKPPFSDITKYMTLCAKDILANEYQYTDNGLKYIEKVIYAASLQEKHGSEQEVVTLLEPLVELEVLTSKMQADVNFSLAKAFAKNKQFKKAEDCSKKVLKFSKNKKQKKETSKLLKNLKE